MFTLKQYLQYSHKENFKFNLLILWFPFTDLASSEPRYLQNSWSYLRLKVIYFRILWLDIKNKYGRDFSLMSPQYGFSSPYHYIRTCVNQLTDFICNQIEVYSYVAGRIVLKSNPCTLNRFIAHVRSLHRCFKQWQEMKKKTSAFENINETYRRTSQISTRQIWYWLNPWQRHTYR